MNTFEVNKILGAVLFTCLCLLALNIGANALFAPVPPVKPGYKIEVKAETGAPAAPAKKAPEETIAQLLAKASVQRGKSDARICEACHTLAKGQPNKIGPNLWNIVGNARGEDRGGYDFSDAMKKKGGKWTYEELNKFLAGPQKYIPGTKMTFSGFSNPKQRADVIDYLRTLSDHPQPLPKVTAVQPPAPPKQAAAAKPPQPSFAVMVANASVQRGKADARICEACHTFEKGGPNRVGPNLWNIVGNERGKDRGGYDFSDAMKKKGGKWTYEELNKFLSGPQKYIPGTKMTFAGFNREKQRADVVAFLRTLSDNPVPLPKVSEAKPPASGPAAPPAANPAK